MIFGQRASIDYRVDVFVIQRRVDLPARFARLDGRELAFQQRANQAVDRSKTYEEKTDVNDSLHEDPLKLEVDELSAFACSEQGYREN